MQEQTPPPPPPLPAPPAPPSLLQGPQGPQVQIFVPGKTAVATPAAIYEGLKEQRRELANQLESLEDRREELSSRLEEPMVGGADRKGLEQRITDIDQRIISIDQQMAQVDAQIARSAAVPGAVVRTPELPPSGPPEEAFVLGGIFMVVVLLPLMIAWSRRIWRRGAAVVTSLPAELGERFTRLEQAVDAIALEVERIGEGQRFMSRFFSEDGAIRALGAGAAEPIEVKPREQAEVRRR